MVPSWGDVLPVGTGPHLCWTAVIKFFPTLLSKLLTSVLNFCNYVTQTRHTYECWEELLLQHVDCMHAVLRHCRAFTADPFCNSTRTRHATCHHSSPELTFMKMKIVVGNKLQSLSSHQGPTRYSYIAVSLTNGVTSFVFIIVYVCILFLLDLCLYLSLICLSTLFSMEMYMLM